MKSQLVYGRNPALACLHAGKRAVHRVHLLRGSKGLDFLRKAAGNVPIEEHDRSSLDSLTRGAVHQGIVLEADPIPILTHEEWSSGPQPDAPLLTILDGVEDPHNFGAIIRTACACGGHAVFFAEDRAAPVSPVAVKSSAGGIEHIDLVRARNINRTVEIIRDSGIQVVALDANGDGDIWDFEYTQPTAIVVGSEGKGIRKSTLGRCDLRVRIPTPGPMPSLNASVATSIALAEVLRQRSK